MAKDGTVILKYQAMIGGKYLKNVRVSSMTVKIENGVIVGEGPFNTHPLEVYFNATDFVNMKRDVSSCS
jgi:hypothetical protein